MELFSIRIQRTFQLVSTLFEHNFSAAFPIFNRPYFADAQYRNYKILSKFLACFSLKGNL